MTILPSLAFVRASEAYSLATVKPNKNTPVRKLSAAELATVHITLVDPQPWSETSTDLCTVLACRMHAWKRLPDRNVRPVHRGWRCAEQFASICSRSDTRPLDVWRGWDLLRQLDLRDDLGVQVWVQTTSMTSPSASPHNGDSFVRLKDRLALS